MYMYQRRAAAVSVGHCCVCFCQPVHTLSRTYKTVRVRLVKLVFVSRQKSTDAKFWDLLLARLHHLLQFFLFTRKYSYMSFGLSSPALARQWIDRGEKESTADQAPKYSDILQHGRPTINVIKASSNVSIVNWRIYNFLLVKVVAFRRMR